MDAPSTAAPDAPGAVAGRDHSPLRPVVAQGAALLALLLLQRIEKILFLRLALTPREWLAALLPELGFVLVWTSGGLALGWLLRRSQSVWRVLFLAAHLLAMCLAFIGHVFFLHTGTRLHLDLMVYALRHVKMLQGVLAVGFDGEFYLRLALVALLFLLASLWGRYGAALSARRLARLVGATAAAGVVALVLPGLLAGRLASLTRSELVAFLPHGALRGPRAELPAPTETVYERPLVTGVESARRPNLLLVILESTRTDVVAPYGEGAAALTPAMAATAARGLVFEEVYASVTHTSKALVGILCGLPPRLEIPIFESLRDGLPLGCLPELLGAAGYRTAFMQTALGRFENRPGLVRNLGFQEAAFQETLRRGGFAELGYLGMDEFAMLEPALAWARRDRARPFFLTLLTVCTHHPYEVPGPSGAVFAGEDKSGYLLAIRHQDRFLQSLLAGLAAAPGLADTVVVLLGDHGEAFGEHRRLQHDAVPYEEVTRVPLIVAGPDWLGPPRRVGGLRHQVDLLPTVLEMAGVSWQGRLPGRSLLSSPGHEAVVSSCWYTDYCLGMRTGSRKVVYHFGEQPTQVFDLSRDPLERDDLAGELPPAELAAAEERVLRWKRGIDAFWAPRRPRDPDAGWWLRE